MEESLHSDFTGEVGEHDNTIVSALISACIAERTHAVCIVEHTIEALDATTGCGRSRRLGDTVDTNSLLTSVDLSE